MNKSPFSWFLSFQLLGSAIYANPTNPSVIQGTLDVKNVTAKTAVYTVSEEASIYWDDFSVAEDEVAEFRLPSSDSLVVIEVTTDKPSTFLGTLKSNGGIFLINPNGVYIGKSASIDTYGFVGSTLPACPCPLREGEKDVFIQGTSKAAIINEGRIKAWENDIYLIGYTIDNKGAVDASQGTVAIAAGRDLILNHSNGQKVTTPASPIKYENEDTGIDNSGMIIAAAAELKADGHSYAIAIQHSGYIDIVGTQEQSGKAYLVADKGNTVIYGAITAENHDETGGEIQILGENIFLFENSNIDASGGRGGGEVFIGTSVEPNSGVVAKMTFVDELTAILADALEEGNGGKIVIGSEETTCLYGDISACGGDNWGNGGTVEVYGKKNLDFKGEVDLFAPHGNEGALILGQ